MKQNGSTITLLSLFIVAFWSCVSRPDEIVTTLQRAESCMEMYPDKRKFIFKEKEVSP